MHPTPHGSPTSLAGWSVVRVLSPPAVDELKVAVVPSQGEGHAQHSIARQYETKHALSRIGTRQDGRERGGRRMNY